MNLIDWYIRSVISLPLGAYLQAAHDTVSLIGSYELFVMYSRISLHIYAQNWQLIL